MWALHTETDGTVWLRTGSCSRCGECCYGDPFNGENGPPVVEGGCPLLRFDGDQFACSDREHPYYLQGCNVFPTRPEQIENYPSCTYRFVKVGG